MRREYGQCFGDRPEIKSLDNLFCGGGLPTEVVFLKAVDWIRWTRAMICISVGRGGRYGGWSLLRGGPTSALVLVAGQCAEDGIVGSTFRPNRTLKSHKTRWHMQYTAEISPTARSTKRRGTPTQATRSLCLYCWVAIHNIILA